MARIYMNLQGSLTSGGPTVAAARLAQGFSKCGHQVIYGGPQSADVCLCIIESGKTLRKVNRSRTKIAVRLDGAYYKGYWHSKTPDRMWRKDMDALHNSIKRDVKNVDHMIYQSLFSKGMIDAEIANRDKNFSIINNGIDTNVFKPQQRAEDGFINLFSHGVMRNDYLMSSLIGVYGELKSRGHKVRLIMVGSMDGPCKKIYQKHASDPNIKYLGAVKNSKLPKMFEHADIGIYPRQGSSSDNVVVEALGSGTPVVIPGFGGNAEFLDGSGAGIVVDSKDWDYGHDYNVRLANAVEKIIPDLAAYKKQSREHAVKNLGIDIMISKYLKAMGL